MKGFLAQELALAATSFVIAWIAISVIRRYALSQGVLDQPTERSSHVNPTPRGGGAGPVTATLVTFVAATASDLDWRWGLALLAVLPTAVAGWIDDHRSLPIWPRLTAHIASGILVAPLGLLASWPLPTTLLVGAVWLLATVSAINVINFMDGIDGLIGLQAMLFGIHIAALAELSSAPRILGIVSAAGSAAFLFWNWSPARIFLGDVGSGALAVIGITAGVAVWRTGTWPFLAIFLPLFPVVLDATVAIVRKIRRGQPITEPHRTHLYQRLANEGAWGHARVSMAYGMASAMSTILVLGLPRSATVIGCVVYMVTITTIGWRLDAIAPSVKPLNMGSRE